VAKAKLMAGIIITCHAGEERRDLTCPLVSTSILIFTGEYVILKFR
jgi:hypothetical protein